MRMRNSQPEARDARPAGRAASRLHISSINEPTVGRDAQLGHIFRNMRLALKAPREAIARRLATTPSTIDDFEAGAIVVLPHWRETSRIVRGYCELLRLDPEPLLWRIRSQLESIAGHAKAGASAPQAAATNGAAGSMHASVPPSGRRAEPTRAKPTRRRRRARALFALTAPVALVAAVVYAAQTAPAPVYHAIALLPGPIEGPVRAGLDHVLLLMAPRRDGLRWIEISDPQLRKFDKLQTSTR